MIQGTKAKTLLAFGTALGALAAADVAEGAVVALVVTTHPGYGYNKFRETNIPNVTSQTQPMQWLAGPFGGGIFQFRDRGAVGGVGFAVVTSGATISTGNLATSAASLVQSLGLGGGVQTFAWRQGGIVGWIKLNLTTSAFVSGAFNIDGATGVIAGSLTTPTAVPEPGTAALFALGTLALGAVSVRKRRKKHAAEKAKAAA